MSDCDAGTSGSSLCGTDRSNANPAGAPAFEPANGCASTPDRTAPHHTRRCPSGAPQSAGANGYPGAACAATVADLKSPGCCHEVDAIDVVHSPGRAARGRVAEERRPRHPSRTRRAANVDVGAARTIALAVMARIRGHAPHRHRVADDRQCPAARPRPSRPARSRRPYAHAHRAPRCCRAH